MKNATCFQQPSAAEIAEQIFAEFRVFRRAPKSRDTCENLMCQHCADIHLPKIYAAVNDNSPVVFILPAFPGKSPNREKVLGVLPDHAERLSLQFLGELCQRIKHYYSPGIQIILCSDGRVFSDVVGLNERDVTAYQAGLNTLINELQLTDISTFNLDKVYTNSTFEAMREQLMTFYGTSLSYIKEKIRNGIKQDAGSDEKEAHRMYCGITRFLFEDAQCASQTKSRTAIQKEARINAYNVIQRSNAWSELIAAYFPQAIRLSIHPQTCGDKKLGIRLINNEIWMTPWHGVAVKTKQGFVLLKKIEAEALGAQLIYCNKGKPSHYELKEIIYEL